MKMLPSLQLRVVKKDGLKHFKLTTDIPEVYYTFSAYPRLLEYWHVEKKSIQRWENVLASPAKDVLSFFYGIAKNLWY